MPNEAPYPAGIPRKPARISPRASEIWDELVAEMAPAGVLCTSDKRALWQMAEDEAILEAAYAGLWEAAKEVEELAKKAGRTLTGGAMYSFMAGKTGKAAFHTLNTLSGRTMIERREFGLTPSARTRVAAADGQIWPASQGRTVDPLEAALTAPNESVN